MLFLLADRCVAVCGRPGAAERPHRRNQSESWNILQPVPQINDAIAELSQAVPHQRIQGRFVKQIAAFAGPQIMGIPGSDTASFSTPHHNLPSGNRNTLQIMSFACYSTSATCR